MDFKYENYYTKINSSSINKITDVASSFSTCNSKLSSLKNSLNSEAWKELGVDSLKNSSLPALESMQNVLSENITVLGRACIETLRLVELLRDLKRLTEEYNAIDAKNYKKTDSDENETFDEAKYNSDRTAKQREVEQKEEEVKNKIDSIKAMNSEIKDFQSDLSYSDSAESTTLTPTLNGAMVTGTYNGRQYNLVNTAIDVFTYEQYVQKNRIIQNAGFMGGSCNILSQNYAVDMLTGKYTSRNGFSSGSRSPATRMNKKVLSDNPDDILQFVYNETTQGRPVALQVTQKKSNLGLRHFVTVVGFDSSVRSYRDLTPENILVLDNVDGRVQTLSERNRKLYNQGKGYYALGATDLFLSKEVKKVSA